MVVNVNDLNISHQTHNRIVTFRAVGKKLFIFRLVIRMASFVVVSTETSAVFGVHFFVDCFFLFHHFIWWMTHNLSHTYGNAICSVHLSDEYASWFGCAHHGSQQIRFFRLLVSFCERFSLRCTCVCYYSKLSDAPVYDRVKGINDWNKQIINVRS